MARFLGFESDVTGLAAVPDATRAYLTISGSHEVQVVNLLTLPPQLLDIEIALPAEPSAIAAAPNASAVYAVAADSMFEIDTGNGEILSTIDTPANSLWSIGFGPDAPLSTAFLTGDAQIVFVDLPKRDLKITLAVPGKVLKAVSPGQELAYAIVEGLGGISCGPQCAEPVSVGRSSDRRCLSAARPRRGGRLRRPGRVPCFWLSRKDRSHERRG